jgi:hypothetical protein
MTIIDSLKRLERAGAADSKATKKLTDAADELADHILDLVGFDPYSDNATRLPAGIQVWPPEPYLRLGCQDWERVGNGVATREGALKFAEVIASGWLDELATWLETRTERAEASAEIIADNIGR